LDLWFILAHQSLFGSNNQSLKYLVIFLL